MSKRNLGFVLIVFQSFAFFVALSALLGRIYFLTYHEVIGIPTTEISLTAIDYTLISPNVTILGVGTTVFITATLLVLMLYYNIDNSTTDATFKWHRGRFLTACILAAMYVLLRIPDPETILHEVPILASSGLLGLLGLARLIIGHLAMYFVLFSLPFQGIGRYISFASNRIRKIIAKNPSTEGPPEYSHSSISSKRTNSLNTLILVSLMGFAFIIVTQIASITSSSAEFARIDAEYTLEKAPKVMLTFNESVSGILDRDEFTTCGPGATDCIFELIMVGDRFVFVKPIDSEGIAAQVSTYAFKIEDVAQLVYISESSGN